MNVQGDQSRQNFLGHTKKQNKHCTNKINVKLKTRAFFYFVNKPLCHKKFYVTQVFI